MLASLLRTHQINSLPEQAQRREPLVLQQALVPEQVQVQVPELVPELVQRQAPVQQH